MKDHILEDLREILRDTLQLEDRADRLTASSLLLGGMPEFDSMAFVAMLTMLEQQFGITIHDDEITAEDFSTLGTLSEFVARRLATE